MKTRIIHTKIWEDDWFQSLSDSAQRLFLYLLTNSRANMCGCYELPDRIISFDTRTKNLEAVKKSLYPKAKFYQGWVFLANAQGYNGFFGSSNELALSREIEKIPTNVKDALFSDKGYTPPTGGGEWVDTTINNKQEIINKKEGGVGETDIQEIADKYQVPIAFVKSKLDDVEIWMGANPGKAKGRNKRLTLMAWVKKDALQIKQDYAKQSKIAYAGKTF